MYDFPASPAENDEYTPPVGGQTYIYKAPRWLVKGIPPTGGGGGSGGIDEAPVDGQQYAREDAAWTVIDPGVSDWADIENKPETFPPDVPIPWGDISGKPATYPPTVPIAWTDVSGKPATYPPTLPIAQSDVTGLVAGQAAQDTAISGKAPTVHTHAQADVTNLVTDLAAKAPLASPLFTGDPRAPTPPAGDNDTSIATTAFVQNELAGSPGVSKSPTHWNYKFSSTTTIGSTPNGEVRFNNASLGAVTHVFVGSESLAGSDGSTVYSMLKPGSLLMLEATTSSGKWVSFLIHSVAYAGIYDLTVQLYATGDALLANNDPVTMQLAAAPGPIISDTAPVCATGLNFGTLWFESDTGRTFIWYYDNVDSSQWVQIAPGGSGVTAEARNRIVNPCMQISQENGNTAGTPAISYWPADQWTVFNNTGGTVSAQRVLGYTPNGSLYRCRITVSALDAAIAAGEFLSFRQVIEANRIADFKYGTATAKQTILRFGFKAPAGTYSFRLTNINVDRSYVQNFTISAGQANTDTEQVFVIPGATASGTWAVDTSVGLYFDIGLAVGSNFHAPATGWSSGGGYMGTAANTNGMATAGNVFELYDVGLHLDPDKTGVAPPWQMPDEAEELRACQRYWQTIDPIGFGWTGNTTSGVSYSGFAQYLTAMRALPAATGTNAAGAGFPAAVGTLTPGVGGMFESRTANATLNGAAYRSRIFLNARM